MTVNQRISNQFFLEIKNILFIFAPENTSAPIKYNSLNYNGLILELLEDFLF